jgi:hypothetical protein
MARRRTGLVDRAAGLVWPLAVGAFAAVLCLEVAALVAVAPEVVAETGGMEDAIFVIIPFPTLIAMVGGQWPTAMFLFFASAILASVAWMARDWRDVGRGFHRALVDRVHVPDGSAIGLAFQLFCVMIFVSLSWYLALALAGVETSTPAFDQMERWELGYDFAKASVYEELITRVLYIGVPLSLIALNRGHPGWWKLLAGAKEEVERVDWFLIAASGLAFGLAHAPGWDFWKVLPTFVSGLGFGYLFVKKGLAPAIVVHFAIDYLSMPSDMFGLGTIDLAMTLFLLASALAGLYFSARFAIEALDRLNAAGTARQQQHSQAIANLGARFVCAKCGNLEASYQNETLRCTKCGQEYMYL